MSRVYEYANELANERFGRYFEELNETEKQEIINEFERRVLELNTKPIKTYEITGKNNDMVIIISGTDEVDAVDNAITTLQYGSYRIAEKED